jgi:small basic protein (TIGR04137 family)
MSQHPSLKIKQGGTEQRSVLKRHEKVKSLQEKKLWGETTSIFHLPKVKTLRLKVKKGTSTKAETPAGAPKTGTSATAEAKTAAVKKTSATASAGTGKPPAGGKETAKK